MKRKPKYTNPRPPQFAQPLPQEPALVDTLDPGGSYAAQLWASARLDGQQAEDVALDQIVARGVSFQHAELRLLQAADSRFDAADLANCTLEKAYLRRVEFLGCRLVGLKLLDADLEDVLFSRSNASLMRLWTSSCKAVRFEHCSLRDCSFDGSNLSGAVFHKCDLTNADFRNARLKGADLRGSTLAGVQIGPKDLAGAIVDPAQAIGLMELFGVIVQPEE